MLLSSDMNAMKYGYDTILPFPPPATCKQQIHFTLSTSCNLQTTDPFYVKKDENLSLRVPKFKGSDMTHKCSWMELNPQWQTEILTCMERLHEKESAKNQLYSGKLKKKRRLSTKIYYSVQY